MTNLSRADISWVFTSRSRNLVWMPTSTRRLEKSELGCTGVHTAGTSRLLSPWAVSRLSSAGRDLWQQSA